MEGQASTAQQGLLAGRGWQLIFGIICMTMIADLQYGWTHFVDPMAARAAAWRASQARFCLSRDSVSGVRLR